MTAQIGETKVEQIPQRKSSGYLSLCLACVSTVGLVVLLAMLGLAYGPAAVLVGVVVAGLVIAAIVHRYRFSLRTYLLAVTILGALSGLLLKNNIAIHRAIKGITQSGGRLTVAPGRPFLPWGRREHRYYLAYPNLRQSLSHQELKHLNALAPAAIDTLDLSNTGITDQDLASIENFFDLNSLMLANGPFHSGTARPNMPQNVITDAGLAHLSRLTELIGIDLCGTDISDEGLKVLASMPKLKWVYLSGTKIRGPGMAHLRSHEQLMMLEINGCELLPSAYEEIAQLPNLISLGLNNTGTSDADLQLLREKTNLSILRLENTKVTDEAVKQFRMVHPECTVEY